MDELFKQFERGDIPNVIELMAAISELSEFWPGSDCLDCRGNSCEKTEEKTDKIKAATNTHQTRIE